MNTQENLLNSEAKKCSFCEDDIENMCSNKEHDTCGMRDTAPTDMIRMNQERFIKLLDFTHFSRHMVFSKSERKDKKKAILNGVNVSVVLDLVCATPKKYS